MGFLGGSVVKNPPVMHETWVQSLGQEDPLGTVVSTHSSLLAWSIPWTEEPGGLQSMRSQRVDTAEVAKHAKALLIKWRSQRKLFT